MRHFLKTNEWNIIEEGFHADYLRQSESIFSLGNGKLGQRGNFEEKYSSDSFLGSYVGGITFLDPTKVGWWKNGYPRFFSRVPNAPNWSGIHLRLIDEELDLATWSIEKYERRLDMKSGISYRDFNVTSPKGHTLSIHIEHIDSMDQKDLCLIKYSVSSINYKGKISFVPFISSNIKNERANYNEKIWSIIQAETTNDSAYLWVQTKREYSQICSAFTYQFFVNNQEVYFSPIKIEKETAVGYSIGTSISPGEQVTLVKYVSIVSSLDYDRSLISQAAIDNSKKAKAEGWDKLIKSHKDAWKKIWEESDVIIDGDIEAQQGIRYNIFQLNQSYTGDDPRLNIASKGYTGEKYGGNTQWNTELCCEPFFLSSTPDTNKAKNLLIYRYRQLDKAIENAKELGFGHGAALYPMVTNNGEERHNEWEITFEEIHRNNIIANVIINYAEISGDESYIVKYGLEVLIAICRFWSQRVSFSEQRKKYVILNVTGPNEYENNVDNNWYTNYSTKKTLELTIKNIERVRERYPSEYTRIREKIKFDEKEINRWQDIIHNLYLPFDEKLGIIVQQDGYLDKELKTIDTIPAGERPINQHWSWDRILRSCFIKQSDVLLGLFIYNKDFDLDTIRRNFKFYEPRTVHESSLSPFVHAILAAQIGEEEKAYKLFLHATRLDLDDYNNELEQGLHTTSMAGSWLVIIFGFAGIRVTNGKLSFNPNIPKKWNMCDFKMHFRNRSLHLRISQKDFAILLYKGEPLSIILGQKEYQLEKDKWLIEIKK